MPYSQLLTFQADGATLLQLCSALWNPEALASYNFIYSRFPPTARSGPSSPNRARLSSSSSGCFLGRKGIRRQVQGGAISQNAVSGQCTRSISGASAGPCRKHLDSWGVYTAWWIVSVCAVIRGLTASGWLLDPLPWRDVGNGGDCARVTLPATPPWRP
jgi:hypothetical protein